MKTGAPEDHRTETAQTPRSAEDQIAQREEGHRVSKVSGWTEPFWTPARCRRSRRTAAEDQGLQLVSVARSCRGHGPRPRPRGWPCSTRPHGERISVSREH